MRVFHHNLHILFLLFITIVGCKVPEFEKNTSAPPNILFLIADDWSYPHAGILDDPIVRTPTFDRLAQEGVLFHQAFCASPSCSPSRAAILTGRYPHQLEGGGNLWSVYPGKYPNVVRLLEENGYFTGSTRKGWGPGDYERAGYSDNPAGKTFPDFKTFLKEKPEDQPFFFWFGSHDPHRVYEANTGVHAGMSYTDVKVPAFMPDMDCIRNDLLDYYFEVERFDRESGNIINQLEIQGLIKNTLIVMTSDNGMPFPRAKANLYEYGTRMPLVISWPQGIAKLKEERSMVSLVDLAPTFLDVAGINIPKSMYGRSLKPLLRGMSKEDRNVIFLERERHANVRSGDLSYPMRAIRTNDYLYIRNFEPDHWPAGDPATHQSVGQYGDVDNSISKFLMMQLENKSDSIEYFQLAFGKRPPEEFYVLQMDPFNLHNEIDNSFYEDTIEDLRKELQQWMKETGDLRIQKPQTNYWDTVEYTPNYQFYDFDLNKELKEYRMEIKTGNQFSKIPCISR